MVSEPRMVSSTSSSSSTTTGLTTSSSITHGVNPSLLLLSNMASMATVKLDYNNYMVWRHQIEVILIAYSMINFINVDDHAPDLFLKDSSRNFTTEANPKYFQWKSREQALFTFLNSTLSPSILALTVGQKSGRGVWKVLEKRFASVSRSHVLSLRDELLGIKKGSESMDSFFQRIKEVRDKLGAVAVCVDEEEQIHLALEALPPEYDAFYSAIRTRNDILTLEELNTLLNAEERSIKKRSTHSDLRDSASFAMAANQFNQGFTKGRGKNGNNRGRGNGRGGNQFSSGGQFHNNQFSNSGQFYNTNNPVLDPQFFSQNKSSSS
nr:uncharacterized protein LOC111990246 [Quercus suber]